MHSRPLADDFAVRPRVVDLIGRDTGKMVGRDIAYAVTAGLNRMHLDSGQVGQHVRHIFELGPVVLNVLAGREMTIATVVLACQVRQHAQLACGEQSVGHCHPQHRCVCLNIKPVAQAQRLEFIFAELAG